MSRVNLAFGAVLVAFAGWYLWLTTRVPAGRLPFDPGPVFLPRFLGTALLLAAAVLILREILPVLPRPAELSPVRLTTAEWRRALLLLGLTMGWVLVLPVAGFLVATPLYLAAAMAVAGAGLHPGTAVIALGATAVVWVAFTLAFKVSLP